MNCTILDPVGAQITGLDLADPPPETVAQLRRLLADHGVLIFPGQPIDDECFVGFLTAFGDLAFTAGEPPVPGFPDLNAVSNVGRATPPRSNFHVDTSYVRRPPAYTALRAVTIPARGGETVFSNQYRAYETLPADVRDTLRGRTITHVVTGLDAAALAETSAEHPVFRRHPLSGRPALYLSAPARCAAISGMSEVQTREMIAYLLDHSTRAENLYRHHWSPGDVVMWDNGCVLHRADHDNVDGDRVMHRGMVAGYGPAAG